MCRGGDGVKKNVLLTSEEHMSCRVGEPWHRLAFVISEALTMSEFVLMICNVCISFIRSHVINTLQCIPDTSQLGTKRSLSSTSSNVMAKKDEKAMANQKAQCATGSDKMSAEDTQLKTGCVWQTFCFRERTKRTAANRPGVLLPLSPSLRLESLKVIATLAQVKTSRTGDRLAHEG